MAFALTAQGFLRTPNFCLDLLAITGDNACEPPSPGVLKVQIARYSDIATHSKAAAPAATIDELGVYDTAPTMVATKKFVEIEGTVNENYYKCTSYGSKGSGGFKTELRLFMTGAQAKSRGLSNQGIYDRFIAVVTMPNGKRYQVGDQGRPAYLKTAFDGKTDESEDLVGREFIFSATQVYEIELDAAVTIPIV